MSERAVPLDAWGRGRKTALNDGDGSCMYFLSIYSPENRDIRVQEQNAMVVKTVVERRWLMKGV